MGYRRWSPDQSPEPAPVLLKPEGFAPLIDRFVADYQSWRDTRSTDYLAVTRYVEPEQSHAWLSRNAPLFDCPDERIVEAYWFRMFTLLANLKAPVDTFAFSEFTFPVRHAYEHNSINCSAAHDLMESRWLRDPRIPWNYARFHVSKRGSYQIWLLDAISALHDVQPDPTFAGEQLDPMLGYHQHWVDHHFDEEAGLFWGTDWMDGMEFQVGGSGLRPSTNAYMFGDQRAIARFAQEAGRGAVADEFAERAEALRARLMDQLWDDAAGSFKTRTNRAAADWDRGQYVDRFRTPDYPSRPVGELVDVREAIGLTPWYFDMVDSGYEDAWREAIDPEGLAHPIGVTTAEQRHARFNAIRIDGQGQPVPNCRWDGPVWAFTTSQTLTAMDRLLRTGRPGPITPGHYFDLLKRYTDSHFVTPPEAEVGKRQSAAWIGQFQDPLTSQWILPHPNYYLHSTYCDLLIHGLLGVRPSAGRLDIDPLIEPGRWRYFCLDGLRIAGHDVTVCYDQTGHRYGQGAGLRAFVDGKQVASSETLGRLDVSLGEDG